MSTPRDGAPSGWTDQAYRRGAAAVVDLTAVEHNVRVVREVVGPAQVMAVVKADGYGHGMVPCARAALAAGASWLGTAFVSEALELRAAGVRAPVLALILTPGADLGAAVAGEVDLAVGAPWSLAAVRAAATAAGRPARIHLEVDTGLSRGGCPTADWPALLDAVVDAITAGEVEVVGIWSHLACADTPGHPSIALQQNRYEQALAAAQRVGVAPRIRHLANSAATFALPATRFDLVRVGIATYGLSPGEQVGSTTELGLRPAMSLQGLLSQVKVVGAGEGVSYGHEFRTERDTVLGLVPVGYGDGVPRAASGCGPVRIGDRLVTVAGRVCMDQFVVDLGPGGRERAGDRVVLFGDPADGVPTADQWAAATGTIGYEIVTRVGNRVPRVHRRGAR